MRPSSPDSDYSQVATPVGPAQWNKVTGALLVNADLVLTDNQATLIGAAIGAAAMSMAQASSGVTAGATTDDTAVTLIATNGTNVYRHLRVCNAGAVAGFFSFDGGTTWHYLPAYSSLYHDGLDIDNQAIQIKRVASGSNLGSVYASVW